MSLEIRDLNNIVRNGTLRYFAIRLERPSNAFRFGRIRKETPRDASCLCLFVFSKPGHSFLNRACRCCRQTAVVRVAGVSPQGCLGRQVL